MQSPIGLGNEAQGILSMMTTLILVQQYVHKVTLISFPTPPTPFHLFCLD